MYKHLELLPFLITYTSFLVNMFFSLKHTKQVFDSAIFFSCMFCFPRSFLFECNGSIFHELCTDSKCGISGGFSALAVIESRLFICPTFYDM